MFWTEDKDDKTEFQVPENVLDVVYRIKCKCIPLEHAYALSEALHQALPWLADEPVAGIHQLYGAESGNGWERPDTEVLYLSRRQHLILRLPKARLQEAEQLTGQKLDVGGYPLEVGEFTTRRLSDLSTLFARGVIAKEGQSEVEFMQESARQLEAMGIEVKKMICGRERSIRLPHTTLITRSLMLADLEQSQSVRLQELGLGPERKLGCGLFLPQKSISAVKPD